MENLDYYYSLADIILEEHSEVLWDMINKINCEDSSSVAYLSEKLEEIKNEGT